MTLFSSVNSERERMIDGSTPRVTRAVSLAFFAGTATGADGDTGGGAGGTIWFTYAARRPAL